MKAFICALLVASVASQQFDGLFGANRDILSTRYGKNLRRQVSSDLYSQEFFPTERINNFGDMSMTFGDSMTFEKNMLTFDELVHTPLFREYLAIPLFVQYMEKYPTVFQKYVESPLFQKFWTLPAFQQYWRNPVLFYKYIVPQLTLVKETMLTKNIYTQGNRFESVLDQILNKNYYGNQWTTPYVTKDYGYGFNPMSMTFGDEYTQKVNYKFLLEKMMAKLFNGEEQKKIETLTDVRVLPTGQIKEQTVGQFVDPITGEKKITYGDIKVVDEKMIPSVMDFPMEKETLLKKYFLTKMFGGKVIAPEEEVMTFPEMYKYNSYNPIVSRMYGLNQETNNRFYPRFTNKMELIKDELIKEKLIKDELIKNELLKEKMMTGEQIFGDNKMIYGDLLKDSTYMPIEKKMDLIRMMNTHGLIGGEEKLINSLPIEKQMEIMNILKANTFGRVPLTRDQMITKDALKMNSIEKELIKDAIKA